MKPMATPNTEREYRRRVLAMRRCWLICGFSGLIFWCAFFWWVAG